MSDRNRLFVNKPFFQLRCVELPQILYTCKKYLISISDRSEEKKGSLLLYRTHSECQVLSFYINLRDFPAGSSKFRKLDYVGFTENISADHWAFVDYGNIYFQNLQLDKCIYSVNFVSKGGLTFNRLAQSPEFLKLCRSTPKPHVCFVQMGGNDLSQENPEKVVMDILSYVQYLRDRIGINQIITGQLLRRQPWTSRTDYNDVVAVYKELKEKMDSLENIYYWSHRGFWSDKEMVDIGSSVFPFRLEMFLKNNTDFDVHALLTADLGEITPRDFAYEFCTRPSLEIAGLKKKIRRINFDKPQTPGGITMLRKECAATRSRISK